MLVISCVLHLLDMVYDQQFLPVIIIIRVQQGRAEVVQVEAFGPFVAWVKRIHNDGFSPFDLTAAERATLTIRILHKRALVNLPAHALVTNTQTNTQKAEVKKTTSYSKQTQVHLS